jgi:hypothetical protein
MQKQKAVFRENACTKVLALKLSSSIPMNHCLQTIGLLQYKDYDFRFTVNVHLTPVIVDSLAANLLLSPAEKK